MILIFILACEIAFWVFLVAGLAARYLLRAKKLGAALLLMSPITDLALLIATGIDLRTGGEPAPEHGLAAFYIGLSIAHGHAMVKWMDVRFAYKTGRGPKPRPLYGGEYTLVCWKGFLRSVGCAVITFAVVMALGWFSGTPEASDELMKTGGALGGMLVIIDGLWALSYSVFPKKAPSRAG